MGFVSNRKATIQNPLVPDGGCPTPSEYVGVS